MSEEKRDPFTAQRIIATILMFLGCLCLELRLRLEIVFIIASFPLQTSHSGQQSIRQPCGQSH